MATVIDRTQRPRNDEKPVSTKDLAGRYRVVHGDLVVPLEPEARAKALADGLPPFEHLYIGSLVDLSHAEADRMLDQGVVELETPPRKGQIAVSKAKQAQSARG